MLTAPLVLSRVRGNETSLSALFMLNVSDTGYKLSARIDRAGQPVGMSSNLTVTLSDSGTISVFV